MKKRSSAIGQLCARMASVHRVIYSRSGLQVVSFAAAFTITLPSWAEVVANTSAPATRPEILLSANGLEQVNITTPSQAGVSHNKFDKFNVPAQGVILNNSRTAVATQTGGWVDGNPHLAKGTARVILNEVTSANPSALNGYMEVAGDKAQVVVANPAGITCNGCGVINANQLTLTTGKPQLQNGNLESYQVDNGHIKIDGRGLDASSTDYAQIISRTTEVNAGIWAKELNVTTGKNQVGAHANVTSSDATASDKPAVSIDVSALGGMYANKITLVGTEKGVGVNNAGVIGAQGGQLTLSADGHLNNSGQLSSTDNVTTQATTITNTGSMYGGNTNQQIASTITNHGVIAAGGDVTLTTNTIEQQANGTIAAGIDSHGQTTTSGNVSVTAVAQSQLQGVVHAGKTVSLQAGELNTDTATVTANDVSLHGQQSVSAKKAIVQANKTLTVSSASTIDTTQGQLTGEQINLSGAALNNTGGTIVQTGTGQHTILLSGQLNNQQGMVVSRGKLNIDAGNVDNTQGLLQADDDLAVNTHGGSFLNAQSGSQGGVITQKGLTFATGTLTNDAGYVGVGEQGVFSFSQLNNINDSQIIGADTLSFTGSAVTNNQSKMFAAGHADFTIDGLLSNQQGLIASQQMLSAEAGQITNHSENEHQGLQASAIQLQATSLDNHDGYVLADHDVTLTAVNADSAFTNDHGIISAQNITLAPQASNTFIVANGAGQLTAANNLNIHATDLSSSGKIEAGHQLSLVLTHDLTNQGEIKAADTMSLQVSALLSNLGSILAGNQLDIQASSLDNQTDGDISAASTQLQIGHTLTNRGLIDGSETVIHASQLNNTGTGRIYGDHLSIAANTLNNSAEQSSSPVIAARNRLDLAVSTLNNSGHAYIFSAGDLAIGGALDSQNNATGSASVVNNNGATIEALNNLSISSHTLNNTNSNFATQLVTISGPQSKTYLRPEGNTDKYDIGEFSWHSWSRAGYYAWNTAQPVDDGVLGQSPILNYAEQACSGDNATEHCTVYPQSLYGINDPVWQYFYITQPVTEPTGRPLSPDEQVLPAGTDIEQAWAQYYQNLDVWVAALPAEYAQLEEKIDAYNASFSNNEIKRFTIYHVQESEQQTQVSSSDPGSITAGGNITLAGDSLVNDKSRIIAGGDLTGSLNNLQNIGASGVHITSQTGTSQYSKERWRGGFKRYHQRDWYDEQAYNPADEITTIALPVTTVLSHTNDTTGLFVTQRTGITPFSPLLTTTLPSGSSLQHNNITVQTTQPNIVVPDNALFKQNPAADSHVLIETDGRFTSYRQWLSSDYMLQKLQSDPAATQKRLGDGFYEQKLVREEVGQLLGRRYLDGYTDDESQYQGLMQNGLLMAGALKLRVGIELTAEQMAALTADMVWMVEREVKTASGVQKVLVPQVYLKAGSPQIQANGTLMAGRDVDLTLSGDLTNSGVLAGSRAVAISADNIRDTGGRWSGQQIALKAGKDINLSGTQLTADNHLSLTAGNDILISSTTQSAQNGSGNNVFARTNLDQQAQLKVSGERGVMALNAGHDLTLTAANITNSGKDSQTVLQAGNNLTLNTLTTSEQEHSQHDSRNYIRIDKKQEMGNHLNGGGDITLAAGNDLTIRSGSITADNRVALAAGNNVTLEAAESERLLDEQHYKKSSGVFGSKKQSDQITLNETTHQSVQLKGNAVSVEAGNLLQSAASQLNAKTTVSLKGDNGVALTAVNDNYDRHEEHSSKNGIVKGSVIETHQRSTAQGNTLTGSDITITSGSDLQLQAGKLKGDNVTLTSAGTTYLDAGQNSQYDQIDKNKTGLATVKMQGSGTTNQTASLTQIDSQNVTLNADGGVVVALPQQSGETLNQSIDRLASQPDMAWLKQVQQRKDIDWQPVQEAYDHWDYSQQSLSPAAAAVIAIAVAAVTGGAGAGLVGLAEGAGGASIYASVGAAMANATVSTLASQAAVTLINNRGNLGATLKAMGSNANIRALATSVVTAGVTAGVNYKLNELSNSSNGATTKAAPNSALNGVPETPTLAKLTSWQTTARVLSNSAVSAGVDSAINGSNFSDVFTNSLRANVGAEVGALTANTVGDYSDTLGGNGSLEKSLVHGVTQAGVAKLSGGDAKAALTAGITTELLSGWMGNQFKDTTGTAEGLANEKDKQAKLARVLGSLAGAIATNTAEGANSGATTGETIDRYNRQLHPDEQDALDKLADGDKEKKRRLLAAACYLANCAKGLPLTATDAQIATAQALQSEGAQYAAEQGQLKAYVGDYKVDPLLNIASRPQNLFNYRESDWLDDYRSDGYNSGIRATTAKFNDAYDADFSPQGFDYSLKGLEFLTSMGVGIYWKNAIGLDARAATTAEKGMLDLLDESSAVYRPSVNGSASFTDVYAKAPVAKIEIDNLADSLARKYDGSVATAPLKSAERALQKIQNEYGGDATKIKDLARNTIIVDGNNTNAVAKDLINAGAKVKSISSTTDELGYSGINATVQTKAGIPAEIQINTPEMIFAKETEINARAILGDATYNKIAERTPVAGGKGHAYYEQWRILDKNTSEAKNIAEKSRQYYDVVRRSNAIK